MKGCIAAILLMIYSLAALAAEPEILHQFFGPSGVQNKRAMYYGEMLKHFADKPTLGEGLQKDVKVEFRLLKESSSIAVYAVLLRKENLSEDWYAFLHKEKGVWKISAVRSLALTGLLVSLRQELQRKATRTAEEEFRYNNLRLTTGNDLELKRHLVEHGDEFDKIPLLLLSGKKDEANTLARKLYVESVNVELGLIHLFLGGILNNGVGYLYVPSGKNVPEMSPDGYIYIEKISEFWYVYKTT